MLGGALIGIKTWRSGRDETAAAVPSPGTIHIVLTAGRAQLLIATLSPTAPQRRVVSSATAGTHDRVEERLGDLLPVGAGLQQLAFLLVA